MGERYTERGIQENLQIEDLYNVIDEQKSSRLRIEMNKFIYYIYYYYNILQYIQYITVFYVYKHIN